MLSGTLVSTKMVLLSLLRPLGGAAACTKPSMKAALGSTKNKNDCTSAWDWGRPAACNAATLLGSGEIPSLENTLPKNVTDHRLNHRRPKLTIREIDRINDLCKRMSDLCKSIEWDVTT